MPPRHKYKVGDIVVMNYKPSALLDPVYSKESRLFGVGIVVSVTLLHVVNPRRVPQRYDPIDGCSHDNDDANIEIKWFEPPEGLAYWHHRSDRARRDVFSFSNHNIFWAPIIVPIGNIYT
jgi:hypothetical protein